MSAISIELPQRVAPSPKQSALRRMLGLRAAWAGACWIVGGNLVYAASQYGMLVALAHACTPRHVGQYALAVAITGPVMFFCNLQLRAILASDAARLYHFREYWQIRNLTMPLAALVVAAVVLIGGYNAELACVILVTGAAKALETLCDLCYGASQRNGRLDLVGKSLLIKGPLSLALLGTVAWLTQSVACAMAAVGISWLFILLAYDLPNARRFERYESPACEPSKWCTARQWRLVALGLPLAVSITLLMLTISIPNILIERYLGEREVGIYAALASLAWAGIPLINALGQTAMPKFGQYFVAGNYTQLRAWGLTLSAIGAGVGLVGVAGSWLCGDFLVACCFGKAFAGHADVLTWIMAAAALLFAGRFLGDALTAMRCVRIQLITQTASALVVLIGSILTLPDGGLVGLAKVLTAALALRAVVFLVCFIVQTREIPLAASCLAADRQGHYGSPTAGLEMAG